MEMYQYRKLQNDKSHEWSNIFSENLILNLKFNFVQPYAHLVPLYYQSIYINY